MKLKIIKTQRLIGFPGITTVFHGTLIDVDKCETDVAEAMRSGLNNRFVHCYVQIKKTEERSRTCYCVPRGFHTFDLLPYS